MIAHLYGKNLEKVAEIPDVPDRVTEIRVDAERKKQLLFEGEGATTAAWIDVGGREVRVFQRQKESDRPGYARFVEVSE